MTLSINSRDAEMQHPLAGYVHALAILARNTGESVNLTYNDVTITITPEMTSSEAWHLWHEIAAIVRRKTADDKAADDNVTDDWARSLNDGTLDFSEAHYTLIMRDARETLQRVEPQVTRLRAEQARRRTITNEGVGPC